MNILASPAYKNRKANPYNSALYAALKGFGVAACEFSKKRVLFENWDIVHIHWPDTPLHCANAAAAAALSTYHILRLLHAKSRGAKVVWTVHNLHAHNTSHPRVEELLWKSFLPLVDATIHLSESGREMALGKFPELAFRPNVVIPHGHYRDCYPNHRDRDYARHQLGLTAAERVVAFVGQIKPYKNVPALAKAFLDAAMPDATLLIAGKAGGHDLEAELGRYAEKSSRIICHFGLLPEDEMQNYLNAADFAVFPYRDILNSGSAILALSFDRPILVPAKGAMGELKDLAGDKWVMTYEGDLTRDILRRAMRWACETSRPASCDLSALDWETIARQTRHLYSDVLGGAGVKKFAIRQALA
jgi:glycosyltransferase involved in cell wall biosynthesis